MTLPTRPSAGRDKSRDSEPLTIEKISVQLPDAYRDGDRFQLSCQMNRSMTIFEERLLNEHAVKIFCDHVYGRAIRFEIKDLDGFDFEELEAELRKLSRLAIEADNDSARETDALQKHVRSINLNYSIDRRD